MMLDTAFVRLQWGLSIFVGSLVPLSVTASIAVSLRKQPKKDSPRELHQFAIIPILAEGDGLRALTDGMSISRSLGKLTVSRKMGLSVDSS
jgi:hypothetical protein